MGLVRSFFLGPSEERHRERLEELDKFVGEMGLGDLANQAARHEASRIASFSFAQGVAVGLFGNVVASFIAYLIEKPTPWLFGARDFVWTAIGAASIAMLLLVLRGALRNYRHQTELQSWFLVHAQARGGRVG